MQVWEAYNLQTYTLLLIVMQGLISNLIRPFRFRYSIFDLGSKINDKFERQDGSLLNDRGFRIQYSYYHNKKPTSTCLVYAHCNSGSRIEGLQFVQPTIDQGWNLCLFDFAGSGNSEGQHISLGYYEWMDLQAIISMILKKGNNKVHLWGRSMGAATIILYLSETKQRDTIVSCVLDSPYCSLWRVIKQFGKSKTKIPQFIVEHVMQYLRTSIFKDHRFDIKELELVKKIHKIDIPIMFIASTSDSFVNYSHAAQLYKWAPNKHKVLEYIQKQHNSPRQSNTISIGLSFMAKSICQKQQNQRQLRILSKKKQLCRKMNGHNMAELITKPSRTTAEKNHINSTGNLGRFSSFCLNNNDIIVELSPKCQKNCQKKQNPHKIQESIIKLTLPPKQMLEQLRKANVKNQDNENMLRSQIFQKSTKKQNMFSLNKKQIHHTSKNQKQNNQNVSNKSERSEDERISKGGSGIKNLNSIIAKKFNFDHPNYQHIELESTLTNNNKLEGQDKKNKTQKINIYLKNVSKGSPTKASKPSGIKVFKKITGEQSKKDHENLNKSQCRAQLKKGSGYYNLKERVKTEAAIRATKQSFSTDEYDQQMFETNQKRKKHYSSHSQILNENVEVHPELSKQRRAWICGENPLCKQECLDSSSKEVYLNKYRDSENGNPQIHHKNSYNDTWNARENDVDLIPTMSKTQLKHFQSIGDVTSYDCNQFDSRKGNENMMVGRQRIIKIQLDKNIFKPKQTLQIHKKDKMGQRKEESSSQKENEGHTNRISLLSTQNISEINPISKFKLKNKRCRKVQSESNSIF